MKIVFVETPSPWLVRPDAQHSLGPVYLGAVLAQQGHEVAVVRPITPRALGEQRNADVLAFSGTTLDWFQIRRFALWAQSNLPQVRLWVGGPHVTALPEEARITGLFDAIFVGEAENNLEDALAQPRSERRLIYRPAVRPDVNRLPIAPLRLRRPGGRIFSENGKEMEGPSQNVITSRGCRYHCAFCASSCTFGPGVRLRDADNVLAEVESLVAAGYRQIRFVDDEFTTDLNRLAALCRGLGKMRVQWHCCARADHLTTDVCLLMRTAGCREISVGIESADPLVLRYLRKRMSLERARAGCRAAVAAGLHLRVLLMIGTPGEQAATPERNRQFLRDVPFHSLALARFLPLPGTAFWNDPGRFDCDILCRDFRQYNLCCWDAKGHRPYVPMIRNFLLRKGQQAENVARMEQYAEETQRWIKR